MNNHPLILDAAAAQRRHRFISDAAAQRLAGIATPTDRTVGIRRIWNARRGSSSTNPTCLKRHRPCPATA